MQKQEKADQPEESEQPEEPVKEIPQEPKVKKSKKKRKRRRRRKTVAPFYRKDLSQLKDILMEYIDKNKVFKACEIPTVPNDTLFTVAQVLNIQS